MSLFFFIWMMNLMEIIPVAQFPAMSKFAFPVALTLMVYGDLHVTRHQAPGPGRLLREHDPPGVPLVDPAAPGPDRAAANILVRPFTLSVRLFANMLAGHMLLLVFSLATWYLFSATIGLLFARSRSSCSCC